MLLALLVLPKGVNHTCCACVIHIIINRSGHSPVYQVTQMCPNGVYRRESAGTGPIVLEVARKTAATLSGNPIEDQLMCAPKFSRPLLVLQVDMCNTGSIDVFVVFPPREPHQIWSLVSHSVLYVSPYNRSTSISFPQLGFVFHCGGTRGGEAASTTRGGRPGFCVGYP